MRKLYMILLLLMAISVSSCKNTRELNTFLVNYGTVKPQQLSKKKIAILEPDNYNHMQILSLKNTRTKLLGYVSLGEVGSSRWYFPLLKDRGFLGKNKNWNSYYINLKDSLSRNILLNQVVPNIIDKGFSGLFLDTIDDVAPYTKRAHLQPYMANLIKKIRQENPEIYIIQNAGLFLLDKTHNYINGDLIEDVASHYDFSNKKYGLSRKSSFENKISTIEKYKKQYNLPFYIVDYANSSKLHDEIKQRLDTLNIPFYVSNINLQ